MKEFPFIEVENKKYPMVIMGEDRFTGWFGKKLFNNEENRAKAYRECLETAYSLGVRGFSISPQDTLVRVLKNFKKEYQDIVCIANPHWQSHYYIGKESLWSERNMQRMGATELYHNKELKDCYWYDNKDIDDRFSEEEIATIRLDEEEHKQRLKEFNFCDFCLVGNFGSSAFITLNRKDIIEKEIVLVRENNIIPIGMCQGGGLALNKFESLDVGGTWVWINRHFACPTLEYALKFIKEAKKPITAYKIFHSPEGFDFEKSIDFIKSVEQIKSIVVGVDSKEQAEETFSKLQEYWI
ncbi:MAG: hypothetical protein KKA62_00695 [Nanoarchaeota archaeon]|nr:hypothetical protein [Nanoarchaeota archaeon]